MTRAGIVGPRNASMTGEGSAKDVINARLTERELTQTVIELARLFGWMVAHFRPGMNRRGEWSTPMQGDPGFPDLVLVRDKRLLFIELKRMGQKPTPTQREWLEELHNAGGKAQALVWRPSDLSSGEIERVLGGGT